MDTDRTKIRYILALGIVAVAAAALLSVCIGRYPVGLSDIGAILRGADVEDMKRRVLFTLRIPRTVMALLAGIGLGLAGSVYQIVFRNVLASPDIIGVANGASLGAAISVVLLGYNAAAMASFAFLGGMLVMFLVIGLVRTTGKAGTASYILAGIILKAASESGIMFLKTFADPERELQAIEFWSMGSFGGVTASKLAVVTPVFLVGLIGVVALRRQIMLLALDDDESRMLGVRVLIVRIAVLTFSTLMVTSIVCMTGIISFVGLIAPHIARLALKRTGFASMLLAALAGAFILLMSDILARSLSGAELPVSIFTSLLGIPFLIGFMYQRRGI